MSDKIVNQIAICDRQTTATPSQRISHAGRRDLADVHKMAAPVVERSVTPARGKSESRLNGENQGFTIRFKKRASENMRKGQYSSTAWRRIAQQKGPRKRQEVVRSWSRWANPKWPKLKLTRIDPYVQNHIAPAKWTAFCPSS